MNTSTHILKNTNTEPHRDKTNEMASAPSEDSEQHGRMLGERSCFYIDPQDFTQLWH